MTHRIIAQKSLLALLPSLACVAVIGIGYSLPWTGMFGSIVNGFDLLRSGLIFSFSSFLDYWPFAILLGPIVEILSLNKFNGPANVLRFSALIVCTAIAMAALWFIVTYGHSGWQRIFEGYYWVLAGILGLWGINGWRLSDCFPKRNSKADLAKG